MLKIQASSYDLSVGLPSVLAKLNVSRYYSALVTHPEFTGCPQCREYYLQASDGLWYRSRLVTNKSGANLQILPASPVKAENGREAHQKFLLQDLEDDISYYQQRIYKLERKRESLLRFDFSPGQEKVVVHDISMASAT